MTLWVMHNIEDSRLCTLHFVTGARGQGDEERWRYRRLSLWSALNGALRDRMFFLSLSLVQRDVARVALGAVAFGLTVGATSAVVTYWSRRARPS